MFLESVKCILENTNFQIKESVNYKLWNTIMNQSICFSFENLKEKLSISLVTKSYCS